MSDDAFEGYLTQWREADPLRAQAWLFLRPDERTCYGALAAMEQEWIKAIYAVREPQVAAVKLGWWREEMQNAVAGRTNHPLTDALFARAWVREVQAATWIAPVDAAIMALNAPPAADFETQCDAAAPFTRALARLETRVWFGRDVESPRAARVVLCAQLVAVLRALQSEIDFGRSPIPMNLLARHGLSIADLARDGPGRRAALRDHAVDLARTLEHAITMPGPLTLFRGAAVAHDRAVLARAARAADPWLALHAPAHGLHNLLKTWRAARTWRRDAPSGTEP